MIFEEYIGLGTVGSTLLTIFKIGLVFAIALSLKH